MGHVLLEIAALFLSVNGLLCVILTCALPLWKVPAFQGANLVTAQQTWEGLWMDCVWQDTGEMICSTFDSMLALDHELQVARALTTTAGVLGALGILTSIAGASWTRLVEGEPCKARLLSAAACSLLFSGILQLIPVAWTANEIVREFRSPSVPEGVKRELGQSLYIGMGATALFTAASGLLWFSCSKARAQAARPAEYRPGQASYSESQYV
ncbi:claudin-4-like [Hemiscyllium ocellatum]|uniref:claudin-4-like n=1 Tax=Hemiscyllium ocellatum TaxID=170820 RepID=UPI00296761EF|nr:claudin-4-like [Hemiscyllium ocellatum]